MNSSVNALAGQTAVAIPPAQSGLALPVKTPEAVLAHISQRIAAEQPSFLAPFNMVLEEAAGIAFLFNEMINRFENGPLHKTFFCNSHMEAVHGAIKLARHYTRKKNNQYTGNVLFVDQADYYTPYFNPLQGAPEQALIPGIQVISDPDEIPAMLNSHQYRVVVISLQSLPGAAWAGFCDHCEENGITRILDVSRMPLMSETDYKESLVHRFEIVCWGEAFAKDQLPFGAFTAVQQVYATWNNIHDCGLHSTTFGGNGMVLSFVWKQMMEQYPVFANRPDYVAARQAHTRSLQARVQAAQKYLNDYLPILLGAGTIPWNISKAAGSWLSIPAGKGKLRKILDASGNSGCNVLGHNPQQLVTAVLNKHQEQADPVRSLNEKLQLATGLSKMFQAVSGASAVEMALIMALLAQGAPKKILLFQGNFGGKTLAALNATAGNHHFFKPLYTEVQVINPFTRNAGAELEKALTSGQVGLVWMEMIQGKALRPLPPELINTILAHRAAQQYLVGIDEILNGLYRCGNFTSVDLNYLQPDLISFAKGFSGMVMPFAITMVSEEVYGKALGRHKKLVQWLEGLYNNPLSCQIAGYVFDSIHSEKIPENVASMARRLEQEIGKMAARTPWIEATELHGLHIRFRVNMRSFPFKWLGFERTQFVLTRLFYKKAHILSFFGRLLPPLNMTAGEADYLLKGVDAVLSTSPWRILGMALWQQVSRRYQVFRAGLRR